MYRCKVNIFSDITGGALFHPLLVGPLLTPMVPAIEMICLQMWTLGFLCGQNKFTTTVRHKRGPIVLDGHDIGMGIPDITIPFVNSYYAIMWPFSSRKAAFSASTVKMNGKAVGCADLDFPMMTCGEPVSAPTAAPLLNRMNTVAVGMTRRDVVMGAVKIVVSIAIDTVFGSLTPKKTNLHLEFLGKLVPLDKKAFKKQVVQALCGAVFDVLEGKSPGFELKVGMPGVLEAGGGLTMDGLSAGAQLFGGEDGKKNRQQLGLPF